MSLRVEAKGRDCQIRIPEVCNRNRETVILCHIHKPSISGGIGLKSNDILGAHGCSNCHEEVDGRSIGRWPQYQLLIWFYEGIFRTQKILLDEGKIREIE